MLSNNFEGSKSSVYGAGVIISKGRESVDNIESIRFEEGSEKWFIAATNTDVWDPAVKDSRYEIVKTQMATLGRDISEELLIDRVLNYPGVRRRFTIFASAQNSESKKCVVIKNDDELEAEVQR